MKVGDVKKLKSNLGNKTNYIVHYRGLQLYLSLGIKLTKIHRELKFKQSDWMKKYFHFNTEKRINAANDLIIINDHKILVKIMLLLMKLNQF